ncbi:MAG TPA: thioredoxin-disulfide reductase [bacterium]|jgi:thioredoxin reductase (NADPH)|nr:thioredoxin-disulfide reductase [Myxococcales bacterium]HPW46003.1 thioredoxin-disulfide reductase [bacterium]HQC51184.1 thioredoxin-disulfide reductase [bacterium]
MNDVIILGSGPAALTAAIYVSRSSFSPLVVEGLQPGGQLTITTDVENFPGFAKPVEGPALMADMRAQAERLGATFISGVAEKVDLSRRPFSIIVGGKELQSKTLIIATGASARWLNIESEKKLHGRGVSACATCDGFFFRGKAVCVIGGGDTALEEAMYLANLASKVTLIHRRDELRASKSMQERALKNSKIEFAWNSVVDEILDVAKGEVTGVRVKDVKSGELRDIPCDGVFVAIGHTPNTSIFRGQLELDENGYIVTEKSSMKTSVDGVFACGDCQDSRYRQAVTAAGTGCMAAIDAERFLQENS